jgi:hypothetical protein
MNLWWYVVAAWIAPLVLGGLWVHATFFQRHRVQRERTRREATFLTSVRRGTSKADLEAAYTPGFLVGEVKSRRHVGAEWQRAQLAIADLNAVLESQRQTLMWRRGPHIILGGSFTASKDFAAAANITSGDPEKLKMWREWLEQMQPGEQASPPTAEQPS